MKTFLAYICLVVQFTLYERENICTGSLYCQRGESVMGNLIYIMIFYLHILYKRQLFKLEAKLQNSKGSVETSAKGKQRCDVIISYKERLRNRISS